MPKRWAVFDLDGTLSNCDHRVHFAHALQWDAFHNSCATDTPYEAEVAIAQAWALSGGKICYSTGRTEPYRALTRLWLKKHNLPTGVLLMRAADDRRASTEAKIANLIEFEREILMPGDQIAFIMEDQDKLVTLWRELGYTCLQPRSGAF